MEHTIKVELPYYLFRDLREVVARKAHDLDEPQWMELNTRLRNAAVRHAITCEVPHYDVPYRKKI